MLEARVEVRGLTLSYRQWGTAESPPLLLVHGVPDGAFVWTRLAEGISDVRRVIAPDLPGFGRSDKPRGFEYSIPRLAEVLGSFVDALGLERFDLGVHDFAGAYGVGMAGRRPDAVGKLLLFNTNSFTGWRWHSVARRWRRPVLGELMMAPIPRALFRAGLARSFVGEPPAWFEDQVWEGWRRWPTRRAILKLYRASDPSSYGFAEEVLPALRGKPTLVVWGQQDRFVSRRYADRFGEALGARVVPIEDAGHFPMVERADRVIEAVLPFLRA
jgi:pimeloyl-ACP methyl ester carboxylesterase